MIPASTALVRKHKLMGWPYYDFKELFDLGNDLYEMKQQALGAGLGS
jgi:hypothetical protein